MNNSKEIKLHNKFKDIKIQFMSMYSLSCIQKLFLMIWNKQWFKENLLKQARLKKCFNKHKKISIINILFNLKLIENILLKPIILQRKKDWKRWLSRKLKKFYKGISSKLKRKLKKSKSIVLSNQMSISHLLARTRI